jgi:CubicO group peptidase (beta-lactamase class C family)
LYSTANDYLRFCRMLLGHGILDGNRILNESTVRSLSRCALDGRMSRARIEAGHGLGPGIGYGLVGRVVTEPARSSFGQRGTFGWDGMGGCTFFVDPTSDLAAVFITQILPWQADLHPAFRRAAYGTHAQCTGAGFDP